MANQYDKNVNSDYADAFATFDRQRSGRIDFESLKILMSSLGHPVADHEIKGLVQPSNNPNVPAGIDFPSFVQLISAKEKGSDNTRKGVEEAFRAFDRGNRGFLSESEFRHIMTKMGEKMSNEEVDEMLREAGVAPGSDLDYMAFTSILFG
ncbi:calmodulin [Coemansia reversa NRRL 1564]|uniref:Calmodulin n=1 Tax=Coemansia reversa (strain ATCC 12441 / NRRL 1564) TaxID=763665 RepID=A0A2G5B4C1_COERN|nr:calmodulin [Coemansia reversa NRRL 1564]|eukprot:PIA13577.1 calmodulin [Coemansia reversa NRRL 1564]